MRVTSCRIPCVRGERANTRQGRSEPILRSAQSDAVQTPGAVRCIACRDAATVHLSRLEYSRSIVGCTCCRRPGALTEHSAPILNPLRPARLHPNMLSFWHFVLPMTFHLEIPARPSRLQDVTAGNGRARHGARQCTRPSLFAASPSGDSHQPLPESRRCEINKRSQLQCEYRLTRVDDVHGNGLRLKASQRDHELSCPDGPSNLVGKNARQSNPGDRSVDGGLCSVDDETRLYSHVSRGSIHSKYPRLGP